MKRPEELELAWQQLPPTLFLMHFQQALRYNVRPKSVHSYNHTKNRIYPIFFASQRNIHVDEFHGSWKTAKTWKDMIEETGKAGKELWLMRGWRGGRFRYKHGVKRALIWTQTAYKHDADVMPENSKLCTRFQTMAKMSWSARANF